jgi:UDPglucose--hexose-1-phosphate uridylyltransferase
VNGLPPIRFHPIRFHPITGEPLIHAPLRAERPNAFEDAGAPCPFCPGNEHETPPEIARIPRAGNEPWRLRVFPNKYPATSQHEVLVESPDHDAAFHDLSMRDAEDAARLYAERYRALREHSPCVTIFKNHGQRAGASLAHLHSQILGTPFVMPRVAREIDGFGRAGHCPLCALPGAIIDETDSFAWIAPHASAMPYQSWIVPRVHAPEMIPPIDVTELAAMLHGASRAVTGVRPAFNWIFMNFANAPRAHWYVEVFPRLASLAGFELGSGSAINIVDPEEAARTLAHLRKS